MYVGRIVAVGRTQTGANAAMYRVSSRSFPHRRTICREGCVVVVPREGHGPECKRNPYTTYTCLRIARNWAIIANGSHTDPIAERIDAGTAVRDALVTTLLALDYEKDEQRTPRIVGVVPLEGDMAWLGIVRHDALIVQEVQLEAGRARWVATYKADCVRDEQNSEFHATDAEESAAFIVSGGQFAELASPVTAAAVLAARDRRFEVACHSVRVEDS
jgi:IMP cyclohydrolase